MCDEGCLLFVFSLREVGFSNFPRVFSYGLFGSNQGNKPRMDSGTRQTQT